MYGNYLEEAYEGLQGVDLADRYLLTLERAKWLCHRVMENGLILDAGFVKKAEEELSRLKFMILEYERYKRMKRE